MENKEVADAVHSIVDDSQDGKVSQEGAVSFLGVDKPVSTVQKPTNSSPEKCANPLLLVP